MLAMSFETTTTLLERSRRTMPPGMAAVPATRVMLPPVHGAMAPLPAAKSMLPPVMTVPSP